MWTTRAQAWMAERLGHTLAWRYGRPALRIGRVVIATGSVYAVGYSAGMRDCLEDRNGSVSLMMSRILARTSRRGSVLHPSDPIALRVSRVGQEVVAAAEQHLTAAVAAAADDVERSELGERFARLSRHRWNFVVVDDATPNSFVAEGLPGFIFVHRGMLKLMHNDDELCFILAHEMAHYLCQHGTRERNLQGLFSALQIVILASADPTGLLSMALELPVFAGLFAFAVLLPASRQAESEADALGLRLVARTCRSPERAIRAHERLAAAETACGIHPNAPVTTHPSTAHRLEELRIQLPDAVALQEASGCAPLKSALRRVYAVTSKVEGKE
jgi:Zn-dependent protease with chaperone function